MPDILVENASQILTMEGAGWEPLRGERQKKLRMRDRHSILIRGNRIIELMTETKKDRYLKDNKPQRIDARGCVVMPGIVDSHTHLVYGGTRENEFYMKLKGKSYLEILNAGGGINATVTATRSASEDDLFSESLKRIYDSIFYGTTTIEIKTGYGLDVENEVKMLNVIERLSSLDVVNVVPTFLGMHAVPRGMNEPEYAEQVLEGMAQRFAGRVKFIDVFCDRGAFGPDSTRKMMMWGVKNNIKLKMHADELDDIGCLDLCNDFKFTSVDHLLKTGKTGIEKIKASGAVATFCPITAHSVANDSYPDIGKFVDSEVPVAIGSDASPVSYSSNVFFAIYLAVRYCGMTIEEALNAATINGAFSAGVEDDRGSIEPGKMADIIILNVDSYRKIPYEFGARMVDTVITNGEIVMRNGVFQL